MSPGSSAFTGTIFAAGNRCVGSQPTTSCILLCLLFHFSSFTFQCWATLTLNTQPIRWQEALSVFQLLVDSGISPTIESYNAAIGACAVAGEWEPALDLYAAIENDVRVVLFLLLFSFLIDRSWFF